VKRILEDHGGELILTDAGQTPGARVVLQLPMVKVSRTPAREGVAAA
jgi:two-component system nitrogen regulation sensor histidine kinase NtrY